MSDASLVREPDPRPRGEIPPEIVASLGPEQRRMARHALAVLAVLSTGSLLGVASSLYLAGHHPLWLIALSPIGRHLVLVAPTVDPLAFVVVGTLRSLAFQLAAFQLGAALGAHAVAWLELRAPRFAGFVHWLERLFARAGDAVVLGLPGPTVSLIAGSSGMRLRRFVVLVSLGLVARMLVVLWIGDWLRRPIEVLLAWIDEYWVPGTILMATAVVLYRWRRRRAVVHEGI